MPCLKREEEKTSMISEQVKELREVAEMYEGLDGGDILREAADTIESLSAKLKDMEQTGEHYNRWIPVLEKKPEYSGYYEVTTQSEINGEVVRATEQRCYHKDMDFFASLIEPEFSIDEKVTAWRNMPKPYDEQSAEDCGGEWIPCNTENLPDKKVLCCDNHGEMILGYIFKHETSETGFSAENNHEYMHDCVKWMEKPKPYGEIKCLN